MNRMGFPEKEKRVFWTRQAVEVENELLTTGVYRVRKEYIEKKNDTIDLLPEKR